MALVRRTAYLGYYARTLNRELLRSQVRHVADETGATSFELLRDAVACVYRHNISLHDYFHFRFDTQSDEERSGWAGVGTMYEHQRRMNPPASRGVLEDKLRFARHYEAFVARTVARVSDVAADTRLRMALANNGTGRVVLKDSRGQAGQAVFVVGSDVCGDTKTLLAAAQQRGCDLVEEFVEQHPLLDELSSTSLNTVRIITELDSHDRTHIIGARLRFSVDHHVDNLAAGGLAAAINPDTGQVMGPATSSDIASPVHTAHPVTGAAIDKLTLPRWDEVTEVAVRASQHDRRNRSVGWDIAITADGTELIEGNHNWCRLLWQLPVRRGLLPLLQEHPGVGASQPQPRVRR